MDNKNIILVPNQRTAVSLKRHQQRLASTRPSQVFVIDNWFRQQWQECLDSADPVCFHDDEVYQLLNDLQIQVVWQQVLQQHLGSDSPLIINQDLRQLAQQAQSGWRLLQRAELDSGHLMAYEQSANYPFYQWINAFQAKMQAQCYCTFEDVLQKLGDYFSRSKAANQAVYDNIVLQGFEQPASSLYQKVLQQACQLLSHEDLPKQPQVSRQAVACLDQDQELMTALNWAQQLLLWQSQNQKAQHKHSGHQHPEPKIAIIIGELSHRRQTIKRQIGLAIENQSLPLLAQQIAIGGSSQLHQQSSVASALQLLQMNRGWLTLAQCQQHLQSAFWLLSAADYYDLRVEIENNLYQAQVRELSVADWRRIVHQSESSILNGPLIISECLQSFYEKRKALDEKASLIQWLELFQQQLTQLGWREQMLSQPHLQQWQNLSRAAQQLSAFVTLCSCSEALNWLQQLCQQHYPLSLSERPIQIIDTIAGALDYSHIWFCGADDQQWPGPAKPHQLIPPTLQKAAKMVGGSAEAVHQTCQQLLHYLQHNCTNLVFSYSQIDRLNPERASAVQLSPLLNESWLNESWLVDPQQLLADSDKMDPEPAASIDLEFVETDKAPLVSDIEKYKLSGGSGLVKAAINCPFTTFIQFRLNGRPLPEPVDGIDPLTRGNLVHWALEALWQQIKDSTTLQKLDQSQQLQFCRDSAKTAINRLPRSKLRVIFEPVLVLEEQRLQKLLQQWLTIELQRPAFEVQAQEQQLQISINGLSLKLRLDRMDRNEQGNLLLIDYKTGNYLTANQWGNPDENILPVEPQLPLYMMAMQNEQICGISFAQLNIKQQRLIGLCASQSWEQKGIKAVDDWQHWGDYWQRVIKDTIEDYLQGTTLITEKLNTQDEYSSVHRWPEHLQKANRSG